MPILIPTAGAEEAPSTEVIYAALGSVLMTASDSYVGGSSIDITAESDYAGLSSVEPSAVRIDAVHGSIRPVTEDTYASLASADVQAGDSFLILADILQEELSGPNLGSYAYQEIHAELLVDDVEIPIKSFQYQVPTGRLGSVLNIRLAEPDTSVVPVGASVKFSLKVRVGGIQSTFVLLDNGKLQQRDYTITYRGGKTAGPADEVSFSSLDVVADKFGLAPRRPVTMFDPRRIRYDAVQVRNDQLVRDEQGRKIVPVVEPCYGLSMRTILRRAYTGIGGFAFSSVFGAGSYGWGLFVSSAGTDQIGCGFDGVITNIPDYKVRRADFELGSSWHDGAAPVVAMYAPIYFVRDNILYILDVDAPLPFGVSAHTITLAEHKQLSEKIEYKPDTNAVLLTYQYDGNDPNEDPTKLYRDEFSDDVIDETGTSGEAGYSKTTVRRWDRNYYLSDTPDEILDTLPLSTDTETIQTVVWYDNTGTVTSSYNRVTHRETIEYLYEGDLQIKQTRTVYAAVADPGDEFNVSLMIVELEVTDISWTEDPNNVGVKLQSSVRTNTSSLCVYDPDVTESVIDSDGTVSFVRMIPVLLAQASGIVASNWVINVGLIPTSSVRMTLQNMKGTQYNVEVVEVDYINNTLKKSYTEPTTGSVSNDPFESKSRTVLLRDLVSESEIGPRVPIGVNAYELPRKRAIELGRRVLRRLTNPLKSLPINMAGVDFTIAQGSIVRGQTRSGYTSNYFVTGYSIDGSNLGKQGHRISQTIETTELPTVA